jgi:hypothetical protein
LKADRQLKQRGLDAGDSADTDINVDHALGYSSAPHSAVDCGMFGGEQGEGRSGDDKDFLAAEAKITFFRTCFKAILINGCKKL